MEKAYQSQKYEDKIYQAWEKSGLFTPKIPSGRPARIFQKKPFVISMPPPNATGNLHLGHSIMLAIQDLMIRYHRMKGEPALWLPGTDHAAIATQNKVEKILKEEGTSRHSLGRRRFIERVKKFVQDSQGIIRKQIRKMGSSCDWTRERYTLDEGLSYAVREMFVRMYQDGLIYRGNRITNWCPRCESTLADDEVEYQEIEGHFYYLKYPLKDEPGFLEIATTRPETMLGDTAVAVNPRDKRYQKLIGKKVILPFLNREIPVIADRYVDLTLGTGALKVTPAHDPNDFLIGEKHHLEIINIFNQNGALNENAGKFAGLDRFEARKRIVQELEKSEYLIKIEEHPHNVGHCYRCGTIIEPLISLQWFVDVNKPVIKEGSRLKSLKQKAIEVVRKGEIEIIPRRFNKIYFHWLENLRDWCISRQIWWGHEIPVWYCLKCGEVIVQNKTPEKCPKCRSPKLKQDPDTLDTWFSSALWTFSTLGWPKETRDLKYFHPTAVMETGYDILFFWIARMIIMTAYALKEVPFKTVYLHGLIRDKHGEKMSKSKPETCIDPLNMIGKYGADALRLSLLLGGAAGNDFRLYEEKIAGYRNFVNKIWNSARYVLLNLNRCDFQDIKFNLKNLNRADKWILSRTNQIIKEVTRDLETYRFSDAGFLIYEFLWGEFCDWYLEISKIRQNKAVLAYVLQTILKLLHPFIPFVTEVIWGNLGQKELLLRQFWPKQNPRFNFPQAEKEIGLIIEVIKAIRHLRAESKVEAAKKIHAILYGHKHCFLLKEKKDIVARLANLGKLEIKEKGPKVEKSVTAFVSEIEIYLPRAEMIDFGKEKARIIKEIEKVKTHLSLLEDKLSNVYFVKKAPQELVEKEKSRLEEEKAHLSKLKKQLKEL